MEDNHFIFLLDVYCVTKNEIMILGHFKNDVWEKRTSPPEDWNAPLPDWFLEKRKKSRLHVSLIYIMVYIPRLVVS